MKAVVYLMLGVLAVASSAGCTFGGTIQTGTPAPGQTAKTGLPTPTDGWINLLQKTPLAVGTALPGEDVTPIDGVYAKIDQSWPQWWLCRRCADYRPAGGIWKLQFERGVMRIYYDVTGWSSLGSYRVEGDRLHIFNDAYCNQEGVYGWKLAGGKLQLEVEEDGCAFDMRAKNLSGQVWDACPLDEEGAPGCDHNPQPDVLTAPTLQPALKVTVTGGDSRFFENRPEVFVIANKDDRPPPEGIRVDFHPQSIPYGLNRVLWWNGGWIEAETDLPFTAMGVQFQGAPPIGWARVLFDGVEVWRGNTSEIWNKAGVHGGYIEVSGFAAGKHTIRAESLDFDYHPVTVASFGFR